MLKTRIIPTILWKQENIVKGIGFDSWRRVGTLLPSVKVYNLRQVDELIILDIDATASNRLPNLSTVSDVTAECFVPLTIGGGIRAESDVQALLRAGADKICLNTASYPDPSLISRIAYSYGSQCVVASIDAKKVGGQYHCFSNNGKQDTGKTPSAWAKELEARGAGEIIITSIDQDGTMSGYDLGLVQQVADAVNIPVIASGGAGKYADMYQAVRQAHASAIAASSMFLFTEQTPQEAKSYLSERGIPVRIT